MIDLIRMLVSGEAPRVDLFSGEQVAGFAHALMDVLPTGADFVLHVHLPRTRDEPQHRIVTVTQLDSREALLLTVRAGELLADGIEKGTIERCGGVHFEEA